MHLAAYYVAPGDRTLSRRRRKPKSNEKLWHESWPLHIPVVQQNNCVGTKCDPTGSSSPAVLQRANSETPLSRDDGALIGWTIPLAAREFSLF